MLTPKHINTAMSALYVQRKYILSEWLWAVQQLSQPNCGREFWLDSMTYQSGRYDDNLSAYYALAGHVTGEPTRLVCSNKLQLTTEDLARVDPREPFGGE